MISRVTIRRFKRFEKEVFDLRGHVVLAGPNNCGKTTMLQAVAACGLALNQWKTLKDYQRHGGAYSKKAIARQAFAAVPLRSYDLLWTSRAYREPIEVAIVNDNGQYLEMEFRPDSTEQILRAPEEQHGAGSG